MRVRLSISTASRFGFLRQRYESIPANAIGAIFFEQETTPESEDSLLAQWQRLLEVHEALAEQSWFATNEADQDKLREFRHQLPVLMNEWFARHQQSKVSTDMSVPDEEFPGMLRFYQDELREGDLRYTIFGHIGDNHVHVNILPRDDEEGAKAREIYVRFLTTGPPSVGGTLVRRTRDRKTQTRLPAAFLQREHLREMAALKRAFDPAGILGRETFSRRTTDESADYTDYVD